LLSVEGVRLWMSLTDDDDSGIIGGTVSSWTAISVSFVCGLRL
jgi:hypothetical protein